MRVGGAKVGKSTQGRHNLILPTQNGLFFCPAGLKYLKGRQNQNFRVDKSNLVRHLLKTCPTLAGFKNFFLVKRR